MDKENPQSDLGMAKRIITQKVTEVVTQSSGLLRDKWNQVVGNTELPIYTYAQTLLDAGVDEVHIKVLLDLVSDLGIDVSDPHPSSSELSVIAGILSEELIGIDLSEHRRTMDSINPVSVFVHKLVTQPPAITYTEDERSQFHILAGLRKWQRDLILSDGNFLEISKTVLEQNNQALEVVTRGCLERFWRTIGVDRESRATIFFRDHKTYAGDVDFYCWGPESEKCTIELSRYLVSLGYKVDHRSNILVDGLVKNNKRIENGYLSAYLQMYFYMGKAIEINGDSFEEHYNEDVMPVSTPEVAWASAHKSLAQAVEVVGNVYSQNISEYPGLKDYPFRLLSVVLMGLAEKHNAPFILNYESLLNNLGSRLSKDDYDSLQSVFYYINQARNIYQLVAQRRWEMITPAIKEEVNNVLMVQSGGKIEDEMTRFADRIRAISKIHFGGVEGGDTLDLNESRVQAEPIAAQSYRKAAERYKMIAKLSTA